MMTFDKLTIAISLSMILGTATLFAGDKIDALETPSAVSTFESTGITSPFKGDDNKNAVCNVGYNKPGNQSSAAYHKSGGRKDRRDNGVRSQSLFNA